MAARKTGRVVPKNFTVCIENAKFVTAKGGAKQTGGGRYNFSEIVDSVITRIRLDHGEESMLLELLGKRQDLETDLEELDDKARKLAGKDLDQWAADYHAREAEIRQQARDEVMNKEETLIAFFGEVRDSIKKFNYFGVEDWLTIRGHWEDALSIGWTGSKAEFIQRWLLWDRATPMVTVEDKGGHGHA